MCRSLDECCRIEPSVHTFRALGICYAECFTVVQLMLCQYKPMHSWALLSQKAHGECICNDWDKQFLRLLERDQGKCALLQFFGICQAILLYAVQLFAKDLLVTERPVQGLQHLEAPATLRPLQLILLIPNIGHMDDKGMHKCQRNVCIWGICVLFVQSVIVQKTCSQFWLCVTDNWFRNQLV
jgi:hypothetical protein